MNVLRIIKDYYGLEKTEDRQIQEKNGIKVELEDCKTRKSKEIVNVTQRLKTILIDNCACIRLTFQGGFTNRNSRKKLEFDD